MVNAVLQNVDCCQINIKKIHVYISVHSRALFFMSGRIKNVTSTENPPTRMFIKCFNVISDKHGRDTKAKVIAQLLLKTAQNRWRSRC